MTIVKIISGTYGYQPQGSNYIVPVAAGDPPISVEDDEALRLVDLGVAVIAKEDAPAPAEDAVEQTGESDPAEITGNLDPEELKGWTVSDLKKLAADMQIDVTGKKKDDIIKAICAVDVDVPALEAEDVIE